ncbi:MAG: putative methyltransferase [Candidatus Scalindua rubra]|uniref:Putative methyltransferase n=1 Tax=Candidatus Scalindua rubra TaxID=1872076 RepID=A0A1E3XID5_9BACT|nr:MAG: putative methyltransferase [Candidatus Scalindua rubra]
MKIKYSIICFVILLFTYTTTAEERKAGRLFPPEKIHILEEHREWQDTEEIMARLKINIGDVVADIGAGSGYFTIPLARRVGTEGLVYAEDIQKGMVDFISKKVEKLEMKNIRTVLGIIEDPTLPDNSLNIAFVANTYHELERPLLLLENIKNDLRLNGKLVIIDWDPAKKSPFGPPKEVRVPEDIVIKEVQEIGLYLLEKHNFMPYHYFLIFKKK